VPLTPRQPRGWNASWNCYCRNRKGRRERLVREDEGWRRRTYVPNERPTWVEVDLDAIRSNLAVLKAAAAPAEVMAVLKADAYGHGARWVARTAALNGVAMLGVASLNEALDLRAEGITTRHPHSRLRASLAGARSRAFGYTCHTLFPTGRGALLPASPMTWDGRSSFI